MQELWWERSITVTLVPSHKYCSNGIYDGLFFVFVQLQMKTNGKNLGRHMGTQANFFSMTPS